MKNHFALAATIVLGLTSMLAAQTIAAAAARADTEAQARYRSEKAACLNGTSNQERATCLKEAGAALAEARRGQLSSGDLARNSLARCEALPVADREDCRQRMQQGAVSGSVRDGGIIREYSRPAN